VGTARRIARTILLGSAPSSVVSKTAARGIDRAHIILGCLQPGQTSPVFAEALSRLSDRLHYVNASGDKSQDATRFWFDTRANLRREMEDRKRRFDDKTELHGKIADVLKKTAFKLGRMLLPGGETKQIEPYHTTAKAV
jgi:predicted AAA+ superfamily ATPase